jgi:ankyrin repeat protein
MTHGLQSILGIPGNMMLFHPFLESWPDLLQGRPVIYFDRNPGAEVGEYHVRVESADLFGEHLAPLLVSCDSANRFEWPAGLIGSQLLVDKTLILDVPHDRAWLEPAASETVDEATDRLRHGSRGSLYPAPPLTAAIMMNRLDVVQKLLDSGESPDESDDEGQTPLIYAGTRGDLKALELLLQYHAKPNLRSGPEGDFAMLAAARFGQTEAVQRLIAAGADVNLSSNRGRTPLHCAAEGGYTDMAKSLLNAGANVEVEAVGGATALVAACFNGNTDIVKALLEHGADANAAGPYGNCLSYAAKRASVEIVKMLLAHGAHPNVRAEHGLTPLMAVAESGSRRAGEVAEILIAAGADPKAKTSEGIFPAGETAFDISVSNGTDDVVRVLRPERGSSTLPATTRASPR